MAKQVKTGNEDSGKISKLPDDALSYILSFLPLKEVVGTSILSSRWRYMYTFISNIDLELDVNISNSREKFRASINKNFTEFVDRVLSLHNTNIERFQIRCWEDLNFSHNFRWLSNVINFKVEIINLFVSNTNFNTLPNLLFSSSTLVSMKLDLFHFPFNVPNDINLLNLKTLHLIAFHFVDDDAIRRIFFSCNALKEIIISYCNLSKITNLEISHHLLKRLTIVLQNYPYS
ncbi:hypothetical protein PTKIN_Ptkin07bG0256000 [Pterospermum kingtungense]